MPEVVAPQNWPGSTQGSPPELLPLLLLVLPLLPTPPLLVLPVLPLLVLPVLPPPLLPVLLENAASDPASP